VLRCLSRACPSVYCADCAAFEGSVLCAAHAALFDRCRANPDLQEESLFERFQEIEDAELRRLLGAECPTTKRGGHPVRVWVFFDHHGI